MFELTIEGFSGPLDLLCHLVEIGELDPRGIKVSQVLSLYSAYLAKQGTLPIEQLGEFILQAAALVLHKALSIAPPPPPLLEEDIEPVNEDEESLEDALSRYRPYRLAARYLQELFEKHAGRRYRPTDDPRVTEGDLYGLSLLWLKLVGAKTPIEDPYFEEFDNGVPPSIPDVGQVERVMERVLEQLELFGTTSFKQLLEKERGRGPFAVTLLALLELSRQNCVILRQEEMFGDVQICAQSERTAN